MQDMDGTCKKGNRKVAENKAALGKGPSSPKSRCLGRDNATSGKSNFTTRLAELIRKSTTCALTGWPISCETSEIDHIVPMKHGGSNELDNLQVVHHEVNRAKNCMPQEAFIRMCVAVTNHICGTDIEYTP